MTTRSKLEAEIADMENQIDDLKTAIQDKLVTLALLDASETTFTDQELAVVRRFVMSFKCLPHAAGRPPSVDFDELRRACMEKFGVEQY